MGLDNVRRSGTIAPGIHLSTNKRTCRSCAVFHDERIAMRSLQKSSPNSCCNSGFHTLGTGLDDPELSGLRLDVLRRFDGRSKVSNGAADRRSGLGTGDGVAEMAF